MSTVYDVFFSLLFFYSDAVAAFFSSFYSPIRTESIAVCACDSFQIGFNSLFNHKCRHAKWFIHVHTADEVDFNANEKANDCTNEMKWERKREIK